MPIEQFTNDPKFMALSPEAQAIVLSKNDGISPEAAKIVVSKIGVNISQPSQKTGLLGNLNEQLVKRSSNIADELTPTTQEGIGTTLLKAPERALRVTGQVAGLAGDVIGEGMKSAYNTIMPDSVKNAVSNAASGVLQQPQTQKFVSGVSQSLDAIKNKYPNAYKDVAAAANIASLVPMGKGAEATGNIAKEGVKTAEDLASLATFNKPSFYTRQFSDVVENGMNKAIRPSVMGKASFDTKVSYYNKAKTAIGSIIDNKPNLALTDANGEVVHDLPQSLNQFTQAIGQTKKSIFHEYDTMSKQAGKSGATVDLPTIAKELDPIINSKEIQDLAPSTVSYAVERAKSLTARGSYSAEESQNAISILNNTLDAFYKNPSYEAASKAYVDSVIVNNLRRQLDSVIENTHSAGYQDLKLKYGALKTIEADVTKRSIVDARKNVKGLIDFSDIFSGSTAVHGIISMNPSLIGQAIAAKGITNWYKRLNDPNRMVKNMFLKSEFLLNKANEAKQGVVPKSKLGQIIVNNKSQ